MDLKLLAQLIASGDLRRAVQTVSPEPSYTLLLRNGRFAYPEDQSGVPRGQHWDDQGVSFYSTMFDCIWAGPLEDLIAEHFVDQYH